MNNGKYQANNLDYSPTKWVNDLTPVNATNMNNIESGIKNTTTAINKINNELTKINWIPIVIDLK